MADNTTRLPPPPVPPPERRDTAGVPNLPPPGPPPPSEEEVHARLNSVGPSFAAPPPPPPTDEEHEEPSPVPSPSCPSSPIKDAATEPAQSAPAGVVPAPTTEATTARSPEVSTNTVAQRDANRAAATAGIAAMLAVGPPSGGALPGSRPMTRPRPPPPPSAHAAPEQEQSEVVSATAMAEVLRSAVVSAIAPPTATARDGDGDCVVIVGAASSSSEIDDMPDAAPDPSNVGDRRQVVSPPAVDTIAGEGVEVSHQGQRRMTKTAPHVIPSTPPPPPPTGAVLTDSEEMVTKNRPIRLPPPPPGSPPPPPPTASSLPTSTSAPEAVGPAAGATEVDPRELSFGVQRDVGEKLGLAIAGGAFRLKTSFGYGGAATMSSDIKSGAAERGDWVGIYVRKVHPGGAAAACGMFVEGDCILEVDGVSVREMPHADIIPILKSTKGMIRFKIRRDHGPAGATASPEDFVAAGAAAPVPPKHRLTETERMNTATKERLLAMIGAGVEDDEAVATRADVDVDSSDDEEGDPEVGTGGDPCRAPNGGVRAAYAGRIFSTEDAQPTVGWMHKMGGGKKWSSRKNWKKRFFRLQGSMLLYYKPDAVLPDESGPIPGETAKGYINLSSDTTVSRPTERRLILETPERAFVFVCPSKEEADGWAAAIKENLIVVVAATMEDLKNANSKRRGTGRK